MLLFTLVPIAMRLSYSDIAVCRRTAPRGFTRYYIDLGVNAVTSGERGQSPE